MLDIVDLPYAAALSQRVERYPQRDLPMLQIWRSLMSTSMTCHYQCVDRMMSCPDATERQTLEDMLNKISAGVQQRPDSALTC